MVILCSEHVVIRVVVYTDISVMSFCTEHFDIRVAHVLITWLYSVQNMLSYKWLYTLTSESCRSVRNIVTYELRMC